MSTKQVQFPGDFLPCEKGLAVNKTGAALTKYGVYALDISRIDADTISARLAKKHLVAIAAGNIHGPLVVAQAAAGDDEEVQVVYKGLTKAVLNGTAAIGNGVKLLVTAASAKLTVNAGATSPVRGIALESSDGDNQVREILFNGEPHFMGDAA